MNRLEVGFLESLAWRADGEVRVSLHLPTVEPGGEVEVRFRADNRRVRRPGTARPSATGSLVEVSAPAQRLAGGTWRIAVRLAEGEAFTPAEARLLVQRGQPIALLPGRPPRTRMSEPMPRSVATGHDGVQARVAQVVRGVRRRLRRGSR